MFLNRHRDARSGSGGALHGHCAAQQSRSFVDADQAEVVGSWLRWVKSQSVIFDHQRDRGGRGDILHPDVGGLGVLAHVVERFLDDAI